MHVSPVRRRGAPLTALALLGCALLLGLSPAAHAIDPIPERPLHPPVEVRVPEVPPEPPEDQPPNPIDHPYALRATPVPGAVQLSWQPPGGRFDGYRVYRAPDLETPPVPVLEAAPDMPYAADPACPLLETCVYTVRVFVEVCDPWSCREDESVPSNPAVALGPQRNALDSDGDGHWDAYEALDNSNPLDADSGPGTDDNCNGTPNHEESDLATAQGWFPGVDVDATQTFDPVSWSGELRAPSVQVVLEACP